jgi:glutamyl-tRNA synthetase
MADLTARFTLGGIGSASAVFNTEKLEWMNSQHLMRMDTAEIARRVEPFMREAGLWDDAYAGARRDWFCAVLELFKPRAKRLPEFVERGRPFFADVTAYDPAAEKKLWAAPETRELLLALADRLEPLAPFEPAAIEPVVRALADERGVKATVLMQAVRLAVSGSSASPGLFEMMALVGREAVVTRLRRAAAHLAAAAQQT